MRGEQYDGAAGHTSRRVVLEAKGPASKAAGSDSRHRRSRTVQYNVADTPVQSALSTLREQREAIRAKAYPAAKRKADAANPVTTPNRRVRARTVGTPNVTDSFIERAARRLDASSPAQCTRRCKSQSFLPPTPESSFLGANPNLRSSPPRIGQYYNAPSPSLIDHSSLTTSETRSIKCWVSCLRPRRSSRREIYSVFKSTDLDGSDTEKDTESPSKTSYYRRGRVRRGPDCK